MVKDMVGANINVGDLVVAPFGKNYSRICEVIKIRPKTCLLKIVDQHGNPTGNEVSKNTDSIVVVNSINNKLEQLGF